MTIEEAKAILKLAKICCEYPHGAYSIALDIAIKALEHDKDVALEKMNFINKPCISSEVCEHDKNIVLDNIISEIKKQKTLMSYDESLYYYQSGLNDALEIINKYKEGTPNDTIH